MLRDVMTNRLLTKTPYSNTFRLLTERLTDEEFRLAREAIDKKIDDSLGNNEIYTAGWMPGNDWSDTAFQPIFEEAARYDFDLAGRLFGLLVFDVFREREEEWWTGRFEHNGKEIGSRTYFRSVR